MDKELYRWETASTESVHKDVLFDENKLLLRGGK